MAASDCERTKRTDVALGLVKLGRKCAQRNRARKTRAIENLKKENHDPKNVFTEMQKEKTKMVMQINNCLQKLKNQKTPTTLRNKHDNLLLTNLQRFCPLKSNGLARTCSGRTSTDHTLCACSQTGWTLLQIP